MVLVKQGGFLMAFFLKKSNLKKGTYLQIYESFYDPNRKETVHHSCGPIGYVHELIASGILDPLAFAQDKVNELNSERRIEKSLDKTKKIQASPLRHLGYAPLKNILHRLDVKRFIELLFLHRNFSFDLTSCFESLVYARCIKPCSKYKTCYDVIPHLYESYSFNYDQIRETCEVFGSEYHKVVEIFTHAVKEKFGSITDVTYFDCTNFYFEIDRETSFQKKGPSKENRKDPIVGLGLLLDTNQIPIGMELYPGNQSEKPILRSVVNQLKRQNNIEGRTIMVADKGLNCATNITEATLNGDGYLFSKSVKQLPETELTWVLLPNDYQDVVDNEGNILYRYKSCVDEFPYSFDVEGKKKKVALREKRVVTYNPKLAEKQRIEINKQVEKVKNLILCKAKKDEYGDASKYVEFTSVDQSGKKSSDKIKITIKDDVIQRDLKIAGYNLLVTSEVKMSDQDIYSTYHNLWRIEESFRIMKTDLEARPAFLQKEDSIKGHFLICYISVLLLRLFQFKVLDNKFTSDQIKKFFREFDVIKDNNKIINLASSSSLINKLSYLYNVPLDNYYLKDSQINKVLNQKI